MFRQFLVRSHLDNTTIDQNHDSIGLADRIVAMGGEQDDLLLGKCREEFEDLPLTHWIQASPSSANARGVSHRAVLSDARRDPPANVADEGRPARRRTAIARPE